MTNPTEKPFTPKGWKPDLWEQVNRIASSITREELLGFYQESGAVTARDLSSWTKEELLGVLDEIAEEDAEELIREHPDS